MTPTKTRDPRGTHLYTALRDSISNGELKPGTCLPGLHKLREEYGISYPATRAAMARLEQEGLVVCRRGSGTYVAEAPRRTGDNGNGKTVRIVAAFTTPFGKLFLEPMLDAVLGELEELGCRHSLAVLHKESTQSALEWMSRIQEATEIGDADVVLQVCPSHELGSMPPTRPTVFVAQDMEGVWAEPCGYDIVTVDARQCGAEAARYLRMIGCKRVAMLGVCYNGHVLPYSYLRFRGFDFEWGASDTEPMVFTCGHHTPAAAAKITPQILACDPLPDAVFATSDDLAHGLCHALVAHGIQPGRDIKVIGCDGQPPLYPQDPVLTSVAAPLAKMGKAAAQMALQRAGNPNGTAHRMLFSCALRKGDTA